MQMKITNCSKSMSKDIWNGISSSFSFILFSELKCFAVWIRINAMLKWSSKARVQRSCMNNQHFRIERTFHRMCVCVCGTMQKQISNKMVNLPGKKITATWFERQSETVNHVCMSAWPYDMIGGPVAPGTKKVNAQVKAKEKKNTTLANLYID